MVCAWGAIVKPAVLAFSDQLYGKTALAPYPSTDCGAVTAYLREGGVGGEYRNRTGLHGFAIRCITYLPTRRLSAGYMIGLTGASHQNSPFCPVADRQGICHVVEVGF